jgi:sterol desaturase/sphingolipid hydroxylase (fatty acid hydroxylase superfamily)
VGRAESGAALNSQYIFLGSGFLFACAAAVAELLRPARDVPYRKVFPRDLLVFAFYGLAIVPLAGRASGPIQGHFHFPDLLMQLPVWARVVIYYLLADLSSYLMHRLMHTKYMWRAHKWHHSPRYMYFMTSVRASLVQQFLFNVAPFLAIPILSGAPAWIFLAIGVEGVFRNDWMHMNVAWRSRWLELLFVTPRYHHIHHSDDPALHNANYGSLFSIWDRLFGTWVDPDRFTAPLTFGTGEKDNAVRMIVGI